MTDGLGRPSTPLSINDRVRALVGIEIGVETMRVVCVSLLGEVLHAGHAALAQHGARRQPARRPRRMCAQAWDAIAARGLELTGIGVGVPGAVDDATGIVLFAPNLGWRRLDLLPLLIEAFAARRPAARAGAAAERGRRRPRSASTSSATARARTR